MHVLEDTGGGAAPPPSAASTLLGWGGMGWLCCFSCTGVHRRRLLGKVSSAALAFMLTFFANAILILVLITTTTEFIPKGRQCLQKQWQIRRHRGINGSGILDRSLPLKALEQTA